MELYIKWYIKDRKGARRRIYNKVDNIGTFIALHLADMLVKHGQANPYTDSYCKLLQCEELHERLDCKSMEIKWYKYMRKWYTIR